MPECLAVREIPFRRFARPAPRPVVFGAAALVTMPSMVNRTFPFCRRNAASSGAGHRIRPMSLCRNQRRRPVRSAGKDRSMRTTGVIGGRGVSWRWHGRNIDGHTPVSVGSPRARCLAVYVTAAGGFTARLPVAGTSPSSRLDLNFAALRASHCSVAACRDRLLRVARAT